MKHISDKIIKVAKTQIGYLEKKSNAFLDHFTKNAGTKNYTKYAEEYKKFTGSNLQGQAWCDMFVDWCFVTAFGTVKAKVLLGNFSAYTPTSANYFKKMGQWHTSPKVGDVIFFKNSERINHTGIVVRVDKSWVYTIEGNTSGGSEVIANGGGVCEKSYRLSNSRIAGYGRPAYDGANPYVEPTATILLGSKDDTVKWVQWELLDDGIKTVTVDGKKKTLTIDGDCGKITDAAIRKYQRKHKLVVDGKCGPATRKEMKK